MIRDYTHVDRFLNELIADIYEQPVDEGHTFMSMNVIHNWIPKLIGCRNVVDMGCGQIAPQREFESYGVAYTGVAIGKDVVIAKGEGKNVLNMDMTFTNFEDATFDLVYSRHSLEHSPFPLLTLMEWHRISRNWLLVVLPSPEKYTYSGLNHYGVMNPDQARDFLKRAGWDIIWDDFSEPHEIRYMCQKVSRK